MLKSASWCKFTISIAPLLPLVFLNGGSPSLEPSVIPLRTPSQRFFSVLPWITGRILLWGVLYITRAVIAKPCCYWNAFFNYPRQPWNDPYGLVSLPVKRVLEATLLPVIWAATFRYIIAGWSPNHIGGFFFAKGIPTVCPQSTINKKKTKKSSFFMAFPSF